MPAHSSGAVAARSSLSETFSDEGSSTDDALGVAAEGRAAQVRIGAVVGLDVALLAVLLQPARQPAQVRHESTMQPTPARSPSRNLVTSRPTARHAADDLVAGHDRVDGPAPLVARLVQVGVADAAVQDVDLDVVGQRLAACDRERRQGRRGALRRERPGLARSDGRSCRTCRR